MHRSSSLTAYSQQATNPLHKLTAFLLILLLTGCGTVDLEVVPDRTQVNAGEVINFQAITTSKRLIFDFYDWNLSFFDGTTVAAEFSGDRPYRVDYPHTAIKSGVMRVKLGITRAAPGYSPKGADFRNCTKIAYLFCLDFFFTPGIHTKFRFFNISVNRDVPIATLQPHMSAELYQCLLETGAVNTSDVTSLDCSNRSMSSLNGIEFLYALESLNLSNNNISSTDDRSPMLSLYYLDNLRYIDLTNQPPESCFSIQDYKADVMDRGVTVDIADDNCPEVLLVSDIIDDPATLNCEAGVLWARVKLSQIKLVRYIDVDAPINCSVPLNDLTQIARLPGFQGISVQRKVDGSCYDFSLLSHIDNLESLETNCANNSITSLLQLTHLTIVDANESELPDFSQLPVLEVLRLNRNGLATFPDLTSNTALHSLYINENNLSGTIPPALNQLINLDISDNQFSEHLDFTAFVDLKNLFAASNRLTLIPTLPDLIEEVNLDSNQISNLTTLPSENKLHKLTLSNNLITDVSHLGNIRFSHSSFALDLSNNQIVNGIREISSETDIEVINLKGNNALLCVDLNRLGLRVIRLIRPTPCTK